MVLEKEPDLVSSKAPFKNHAMINGLEQRFFLSSVRDIALVKLNCV
jgi:hypothetical protein